MASEGLIVGIDLGTTNSAVAVVSQGQPHLISVDGAPLLPSVVGTSPEGTLLVGATARNQYALFPERTVRSVKRRMGESVKLSLGEQELSPEEISALILRRLKEAAEAQLEQPVHRAVVTVPAYFSDAQRTATREAGEVAGFTVERIINEPTAAALCYAESDGRDRTLLVYDLGGGTFDVSVVRVTGDVIEVLASHGDTALGGDDMDAALMRALRTGFEEAHGLSLQDDARAQARLLRASEEAKIRLSTESYVRVSEEHLASVEGVGKHLDYELQRRDYEELVAQLIERTQDSVHIALREASFRSQDLDEVVLVGGAARTPRVAEMLHQVTGLMPRMDVSPDEAVALGAALQGARLAGQRTDRVLVDVSPFTFGTSHLGLLDGLPSTDCYKPIIRRNSPLPTRQTEVFYTVAAGQTGIDAQIFQGESEDARQNIPIGRFMVEGLDARAPRSSPILFDMRLNLDGILEVEVTEKRTGLNKAVTIADAFRKLSPDEIAEARRKLDDAFGTSAAAMEDEAEDGDDDIVDCDWEELDDLAATGDDEVQEPPVSTVPRPGTEIPTEQRGAWTMAGSLLEKAQGMIRQGLADVDRAEVDASVTALRTAMEQANWAAMAQRSDELGDMLFYLE